MEQLGISAYEMNIDNLDVHAVSSATYFEFFRCTLKQMLKYSLQSSAEFKTRASLDKVTKLSMFENDYLC